VKIAYLCLGYDTFSNDAAVELLSGRAPAQQPNGSIHAPRI
jgi:hypothetical protein